MTYIYSLVIIIAGLSYSNAFCQSGTDTSGKVHLYLACENCDFDFIRKEISYVDYVRDPAQADVHCYVVKENAGNGGSRYTFTFLGHNAFENINDTLQFLQQQSNTSDEFRTETVHTLTLGLTRYVSHTPQAALLTVSSKPADTIPAAIIDPWNSWIFTLELNENLYIEQQHANYNYYGGISANRTTSEWKIRTDAYLNYSENIFSDLGIKGIARTLSIDGLIVKSISDHLSTGPSVSIGISTYRNRKLDISGMWGLEYDIFPYSESTSRQLRILYKIGADKFSYFDSTIYNKTEELIGSHILSASLIFQKPWGSAEFTLSGSQYLHDLSQTEMNIYANLQLRLFEGLSLRITGNYSSIHDQIFLAKTGLTDQDILLQLQQLKTDYAFYTTIGLSYTFGSIYNNVVNPRFGN